MIFTALLTVLGCGAEVPAADPPPPNDASGALDGAVDAAPFSTDGSWGDGGAPQDSSLDAGAPLDATRDIGLADTGPVDPLDCPSKASERPVGSLRTDGCRFRVEETGTTLPRAVVVSADSVARALGTPYHEASHYAQLKDAGFDLVWFLVTWNGLEPLEGQYNGAYMGRVCEHVVWAHEAGLDVVLAMHQDRYSAAQDGAGMPDWTAAEANGVEQAWDTFWTRRVDQFKAAWGRLLATCDPEQPPVGIAPLVGPAGGAEAWTRLANDVREMATTRFGPILLFVEPATEAGTYTQWRFDSADTVFSPTGWGAQGSPGASGRVDVGWMTEMAAHRTRFGVPLLFRGVGGIDAAALDAALGLVESIGAAAAVWQDGFGGDYGLRDEDGEPAGSWNVATQRAWPIQIAGSILSFGARPDGFFLSWWHDATNQGVSRVSMVGGPPIDDVEFLSGGAEAPIWAYDPSVEEVTLVVEGPPRIIEVMFRRAQ